MSVGATFIFTIAQSGIKVGRNVSLVWFSRGLSITDMDYRLHPQDDTYAIKAQGEDTENVLIENCNSSGVGLTIGSIGGKRVNNITFRNVMMHHPNKGIYVKFRGSGSKGVISNVLYENIWIEEPSSWPIWIGPAQQDIKESSGPYNPCHGDPCSLCWPTIKSANCDAVPGLYENITLRNVTINKPKDSPGVIFGNTTTGNGIRNLLFDGVRYVGSDCFTAVPQTLHESVCNSLANLRTWILSYWVAELLAKTQRMECGRRITTSAMVLRVAWQKETRGRSRPALPTQSTFESNSMLFSSF